MREGEVTEGDVIGGYRLLAPLGEGGMGTVWRAEQTRLGRHAAVKVIRHDLASDPEFRRRFEAEARAAAAIGHPNVVTVFDAGEAAGALYLAMALVEGGTLRELLDRDGRLEPARAVELVRQIGDGLDAVHAAGLVHRDVKPGNVLLGDGGRRAQITDFGVAKLVGGSGVTRTGSMVGTLDYLAPEQVLDRPVDARTDVYALGCLLFELLCGHVPFAREAAPARMWAHVHDPPPRVSEAAPVATTFDAVIARAMAKEPGERHASAGALAAAAGRALAGTADGGAPPTAFAVGATQASPAPRESPGRSGAIARTEVGQDGPQPMPARPPRSHRRLAVSGAGAVVLLGAGVAAAAATGVLGGGEATRPPSTSVSTTTATTSGSTLSSPTNWPGGSGYTAILASMGTRRGAEREAEQAEAGGIGTGILRSDGYRTLRPGYWVVFSGAFEQRELASRRAAAARREGFRDAYVSYIEP